MIFVDGENLAIRGKHFAKRNRLGLITGEWYEPDVFLWLPEKPPETVLYSLPGSPLHDVRRSHYYTSFRGGDLQRQGVRRRIRDAGFEPKVFPRTKRKDSKGVDIAMARDVLVNGFDGNYDACLLVAGDGDYIPLVEEVKRRGRHVVVSFFEKDLSEDLRIEADHFISLEPILLEAWKDYLYPRLGGAMLQATDGTIGVGLFGKRREDGTCDQYVHRIEFNKEGLTAEDYVKPELHENSSPDEVREYARTALLRLKGDAGKKLSGELEEGRE